MSELNEWEIDEVYFDTWHSSSRKEDGWIWSIADRLNFNWWFDPFDAGSIQYTAGFCFYSWDPETVEEYHHIIECPKNWMMLW